MTTLVPSWGLGRPCQLLVTRGLGMCRITTPPPPSDRNVGKPQFVANVGRLKNW